MRKLTFGIYVGTIWNLFAVSTVLADNCSSPGDCLQTAGYNAMVAIIGGGLGIVTALFGSRLAELLGKGITDAINKLPDSPVSDVLVGEANAATVIPMPPPSIKLPLPGTASRLEKPPGDPGGPSPGQPPAISTGTVTNSTGTITDIESEDKVSEQQEFDLEREMSAEIERLRERTGTLADRTRQAAIAHSTDCADSVAQIANEYGITDLNGLRANAQVQHMNDNNWSIVSAEEAQRMANHGELVIAGRANPGRHGHVAVVVPGEMVLSGDGNYYPVVAGGAYDPKNPNTPGAAYSATGQGVNFAWVRNQRREVQYYVAPQPPQ